jgi:hypothetical protein
MDDPDRPLPPDADPGAVATYRYRLTRADALAFERGRPPGLAGSAIYVIALAAAGVELGMIAGDWDEDWRFWLLGAALAGLHAAIAYGIVTFLAWLRAARRVPSPIEMELEDRGDRLAVRGGGRELEIPFAAVAATALSPGHLIVSAPPETLIVPRTAFARPAGLSDLVERIEAAGRDD